MGASDLIKRLSEIIDRCESDGRTIRRVEAEPFNRESCDESHATIDVSVSLCSTEETSDDVSPRTASIQDDGGLQVTAAPSSLPEMSQYIPEDVSADREGARIGEDGSVLVTYTLAMGAGSETPATSTADINQAESESQTVHQTCSGSVTANSTDCESPATDDAETDTQSLNHRAAALAHEEQTRNRNETQRKLEAVRNEDLPPYEDTEYLQCLYESFDTFTEMSEELERDVASETVRRYMIDAGVHEPSTYDTETEAEDQSSHGEETETNTDGASEADADPTGDDTESDSTTDGTVKMDDPIDNVSNKQIVADGIGLPDDLTIEELADTIQASMTLYDVQRQLDLSRDCAQELLEQLNLIDLVMRRVADNPEKQVSREKIAERIRSSAAGR